MMSAWCHFLTSFALAPEHWNYLGVDESLGPVAVSLRREKLEEHKEHGQQYNYRVIFRTSEVRWREPPLHHYGPSFNISITMDITMKLVLW